MSAARDGKAQAIQFLSQFFTLRKLAGQSLFKVDSQAVVYLRYSKDLGGRKFFFGIGEADFRRFLGQNLHVLLVCGDAQSVLVLPGETLSELVGGVPVSHGQWKMGVHQEDKRYIMHLVGKGKFDITEFKNHFDLTPMSLRGSSRPTVREFMPLQRIRRRRKAEEPAVVTQDDLQARLRETVRDSANPKRFEHALSVAFAQLGFICRAIGGPGETDVLIEAPVRIVVDGKSTTAPSLSHINFTRIKQHRHAQNAVGMVVVSVGFQPAVIRDAELEGAGLLTVDTLCQLLTLHQRLPLPLLNLADVFAAKGLISLERFSQLTDVEARLQQWWRRVNLVVANLDFEWRSLPEIKGRLEVICQQQQTTWYSTEELAGILRWLSSWPVRAIEECNDKYRALYTPRDAWQRVTALFRIAGEAVPERQGLAH